MVLVHHHDKVWLVVGRVLLSGWYFGNVFLSGFGKVLYDNLLLIRIESLLQCNSMGFLSILLSTRRKTYISLRNVHFFLI